MNVIFLTMSFLIRNCLLLSLFEKRHLYLLERTAFSRNFVLVQQFAFLQVLLNAYCFLLASFEYCLVAPDFVILLLNCLC